MKSFLKLIFLPLLSVGLFIFVYLNNIQPKLGLDLQGGVSVILTAEEGTDPELIEQAVEIMRTRISAFGEVQEPEISISGENSVLVQLPGLTDQEKAIEAVGTTGLLTFRPVLNSSLNLGYSPALTITPNEDDPDNPIVTAPDGVDQLTGLTLDDNPDTDSYLLSLSDGFPIIYHLGPAELTGNDIDDALAVYPQNEWIVQLVLKDTSEQKFTDLTKKLAKLMGEQRRLAIVLDGQVISAPGIAMDVNPEIGITGGTAAISMGNSDQGESANNLAVILRYGALPVAFERSSIQKVSATLGPAELTGNDIDDALAVYPQNEWIVQLVLKDTSEQKFTDLTKKLAKLMGEQRRLAIVLDGQVISAPGIAMDVNPEIGITGGTAAISMGNSDQGESANNLAVILRYGALPVAFERSSIQKVSATLGENTLSLGLQAGFVGLIIVSLFLLFYYRLSGIIAILGLGSFGALFYSVIALLGEYQGYTLTLAGIAGVIVSIGLTADSYIVIFEKLKDELKVGRSFNFAAEKAVTEAWNTILVADFVSIIASVILYILAIGPIRGFALTLGLATVFDLFYTRMFIRNAVPLFGNITDNPRSYFPLTKKDIENV